jgi:tetratricopeptide (TPR) repeat protein
MAEEKSSGKGHSATSPLPLVSQTAPVARSNSQSDRTDIDRIFQKALMLHQKGEARKAARLYENVLAIQPGHFGSLHYLGLIRAQQNRYGEALTLLRSAVEQNPRSADAQINLAVLFETLNRPEDTITHCRSALALKSDSAEAHFTVANAYKRLNRLQEAAEHFRQAIVIRPGYIEAYYNLANVFSAVKLNEQALECFDRAISLRPAYPKALNNRGVILQRLTRNSDSLNDFDRAVAIQPDYFEALINRGNTLSALARGAEAIASFDRALALKPIYADSVTGRGISILDGRKTPFEVNAWHYGAAIAHHGKGMVLRPTDLPHSTECLERALSSLMVSGALAAGKQKAAPPRYPFEDYPHALRAAVSRLNAKGIEPFLTGGTLLAAMRDRGDFITFDKDIDFGIRSTVSFSDLRNAFEGDPDFTLSWDPGEEGPLINYFWQEKVAIDFFHFHWTEDHVWCGLDIAGYLMKWIHSPFDLIDLDWQGVKVKIPADSDRFLTEVYGDWRTPQPYFGLFASPNIEGGFPPLSRNIAYSAIAIALSRSEATKATEYCRQVLAFEPKNSLINQLLEGLVNSETAAVPYSEAILSNGLGSAVDDLPG